MQRIVTQVMNKFNGKSLVYFCFILSSYNIVMILQEKSTDYKNSDHGNVLSLRIHTIHKSNLADVIEYVFNL